LERIGWQAGLRYCSTRTPLNAVAFTFRTETVMSEAPNADVLERGLLIGGKSVSASSGKLADDVSPWDGEIYSRRTPATASSAARPVSSRSPSSVGSRSSTAVALTYPF
jgi:hypothetical protein